MDVHTIDCHYADLPKVAAAYLLVDGDEAAFVETCTSRSLPHLLGALADAGLTREQVRYVVITHIHLDHAGGAGALMAACPNATLLAHPKAAPHAVDPSRIVAGATTVYGDQRFAELYGEVTPIAAPRVRALEDEAEVPFGRGVLRFLHTRGHANHHFVVVAPNADAVFTGDAFGIQYPRLQSHGVFAFPSTSPTDFDAAAAHEAVDRIVGTGMGRAFPTHFGEQRELDAIAAQLHSLLDEHSAILEEADAADLQGPALDSFCQERVAAVFRDHVEHAGLTGHPGTALLELDIDLNAQGISFALAKRRYKRQRA
ncbi:MAG: MBL fold metallo-hydrolase [Deltaproteobacteria bacterium]|nr:MBL fold metallo-hydrolase [Deltaproteobacteria bacterium]